MPVSTTRITHCPHCATRLEEPRLGQHMLECQHRRVDCPCHLIATFRTPPCALHGVTIATALDHLLQSCCMRTGVRNDVGVISLTVPALIPVNMLRDSIVNLTLPPVNVGSGIANVEKTLFISISYVPLRQSWVIYARTYGSVPGRVFLRAQSLHTQGNVLRAYSSANIIANRDSADLNEILSAGEYLSVSRNTMQNYSSQNSLCKLVVMTSH